MILNRLSVLLMLFFLFGCGQQINQIPDDKFIGLWELKGRGTFDGMQIRIQRTNGNINGRIFKLNDNKIVKMFADTSDIWVSEIKRSSNFEFRLTERRIARDLFSLYGISTSQEFKVEFIDDNTIGLGSDSSDPQSSSIIYRRIK